MTIRSRGIGWLARASDSGDLQPLAQAGALQRGGQ